MTAFDLVQKFSQLKEDSPHTCYSAPLAAIGGRDVIASRIPWFAVRSVAGSEVLGVGHVRGWSPSLFGLQVNARPDVDEASIDEAIAALRSVGKGLVRFDARVLPWVDARERWLRWSGIRAAGSNFVLEDRLAIDDGPHRQAAATAHFDEFELRRLLAAGSRPNCSAELRREAVFLNDDSTAASASLLWLVPGVSTPSGSDYRWTDGRTAFALAAHAILSAAESEIAYWQEECWQAARYRRLANAWSGSGASVPTDRRTLGIIAEQFTLAASILLHASVVPAGQRRRAKLERAAGIIAGLAELHTEARHDHT